MPNQRLSIKGKSFSYRTGGWKYSIGVRVLLLLLLAVIFYMSLSGKWIPERYDIRLGVVSDRTIFAPTQIENAIETQKAKEEAGKKVQPVFTIVPMKNEQMVAVIYEKLRQINADEQLALNDKVNVFRNVFPVIYKDHTDMIYRSISPGPGSDLFVAEMKARMEEQPYRIPEEMYFKFPRLLKEDLAVMEPVTVEIVTRLMADQIQNAQTARAKVAELVNASSLAKATNRELVQEIARFALTPNRFLNQQATDEEKAQARDNTKPVYINKDDILVQKGELVTEELYQRVKSAGLLKEKVNYWPQLGLAITSLLMTVGLYMFIRHSELPIRTNNVQLVMLIVIVLLNVVGMKIIALGQNLEYPYIGYLVPAAMGSMLIALMLDIPLAVISALLFSIISSVLFNINDELFDFRYGFVSLVTGLTSVFAAQRANQRASILKVGTMTSITGAAAVIALTLLENDYTRNQILFSTCFAVAAGLLTAVLVIGLMPFFEAAFGILSPLKLVELSNPNHPLLRKLLTETPGTYHHSVMVGNLSEAAAESVGADGLLCRVGSFYHDIGKTRRPSYFIENQMNIENPHDRIDPELSKSIIVAHARDGVEMLKEQRIPKPIRDIAEQHHGTTLLKFFYHKALKRQADEPGEEPVIEEDFRYPGPKAQSKEAAIVGIADGVEAAVRSLRNPTIEQIDSTVRKIIKERLDDGQFNDCDLTLKELETIAKTLNETLLGIFHSRIEYPSELPSKSDTKGVSKA
ncbi:HD family phosphohydrolase [Paenibacillus koleovorans]|uniref:HD family phosphohydrolase n=1 Tax=Paenibacillus koleovorans TaxID=121608 RepID=UPI0015808535|nr:HDIG domain-containing metalloprotein [Paenibacillus koleovorans]